MNIIISPEAAMTIASISAIATGLTKKAMDWTPDSFDTKRWAQLTSLACCIVASFIWLAIKPGGTWLWIAVRPLLAWAGSNTLHSGIKTGIAHVARKKVDDSGE